MVDWGWDSIIGINRLRREMLQSVGDILNH